MAKVERTPQGSQRRFVVTNLPDRPEAVYRDFYVRRGAVPEQPIGELKNGLQADRLSACGFCANSFRLLLHVVGLCHRGVVPGGDGGDPGDGDGVGGDVAAAAVEGGGGDGHGGAADRLHVSETWPYRDLWVRVQEAVQVFVARLSASAATTPATAEAPPM